MKQLTIEQKAIAYDEAIKRAKELLEIGVKDTRDKRVVLSFFPELKGGEDEEIRKDIVAAVETYGDFTQGRKEEIYTWLKKQGEQKPYGQRKECEDCQFNYAGECKGCCALKRNEQKSANKVEPKFKVGDTVTVKPMSCHGKVFKGEPFKIVDIIEDNYVSDDGKAYSISLQDGWELVEQKPAWSEEDEAGLGDALWAIQQARAMAKNENDMGNLWYAENWLKSIKGRVQSHQEWSEEDEKNSLDIKCLIGSYRAGDDEYRLDSWIDSLKDRVQPKVEWSEEDKNTIEKAICVLEANFEPNEEFSALDINRYQLVDRLKSLRHRNTWKPSEEQLKSLQEVIDVGHYTSYPNALETLYEQLKQL